MVTESKTSPILRYSVAFVRKVTSASAKSVVIPEEISDGVIEKVL
jgi:hypothetical protein